MIFEKAYAKINLTLSITGRLPDGYHSLETVMQTVSLFDDVSVEKSDTLRVECGALSGESNLAYKAAKAFFEHAGIRGGAVISITKRIPVYGGFGGGSADAAATLRALNALYDAGLSYSELCALASKLGSDVPFLIKGGTALCTGKGEIMTPIKCKTPLYYCLCAPSQGASTAEMFARADKFAFFAPRGEEMARSLERGDINAAAYALHNDFTDICSSVVPETALMRFSLLGCGALNSSLTGSGSGCFGVFANKAGAENAAAAMGKDVFACAAETVAR